MGHTLCVVSPLTTNKKGFDYMKEQKEMVSFRLEKSLLELIEKEASKKYLSKSDIIKQAILLYFTQN